MMTRPRAEAIAPDQHELSPDSSAAAPGLNMLVAPPATVSGTSLYTLTAPATLRGRGVGLPGRVLATTGPPARSVAADAFGPPGPSLVPALRGSSLAVDDQFTSPFEQRGIAAPSWVGVGGYLLLELVFQLRLMALRLLLVVGRLSYGSRAGAPGGRRGRRNE